jgi:hypothetical protein
MATSRAFDVSKRTLPEVASTSCPREQLACSSELRLGLQVIFPMRCRSFFLCAGETLATLHGGFSFDAVAISRSSIRDAGCVCTRMRTSRDTRAARRTKSSRSSICATSSCECTRVRRRGSTSCCRTAGHGRPARSTDQISLGQAQEVRHSPDGYAGRAHRSGGARAH